MDKLLLRVPEAAELLGLGRTTCYDLIARGELPSIHVGRSLRIPLDGLRNWVAQQGPNEAQDAPQQNSRT